MAKESAAFLKYLSPLAKKNSSYGGASTIYQYIRERTKVVLPEKISPLDKSSRRRHFEVIAAPYSNVHRRI